MRKDAEIQPRVGVTGRCWCHHTIQGIRGKKEVRAWFWARVCQARRTSGGKADEKLGREVRARDTEEQTKICRWERSGPQQHFCTDLNPSPLG